MTLDSQLRNDANIFETIVNNRAFTNASIILFLNKTDLLEQKIQRVNIQEFFPQFSGNSQSLDAVQKFQLELFNSRRRDRTRPFFHHFTTAVDTENIRFVFQAVKDTILRRNIDDLMLHWRDDDVTTCVMHLLNLIRD